MYSRGKIVHKGCAVRIVRAFAVIVKWCTKIDKCKHIQKFIHTNNINIAHYIYTNTLYNIRRRLAGGITKTRNQYNLSGASHTHRHKYYNNNLFIYQFNSMSMCCVYMRHHHHHRGTCVRSMMHRWVFSKSSGCRYYSSSSV